MLLKKTSLAIKLIVIIVIGVSIIFISAFVFNYYSLKKFYLDSARNNARDLTRIVNEHVSATLGGVQKVTATIATLVEKQHYHETELIAFLENAITYNPEIYGMAIAYEPYAFNPEVSSFAPFVYREHGKIRVSQAPSNYLYWLWYSAPKTEKRPVWSDPYVNTAADSISTTYAVPFYREKTEIKQFQGVVSATISLEWLQKIVSSTAIGQTGYAFLIYKDGYFVTAPKTQFLANYSIFFLATISMNPNLDKLGRDMVQGKEGFVQINDFIYNKKSWVYYAPVSDSGFFLGVVIPETELFAGLNHLYWHLVLIALGGLILLVMVISVISRRITKPLRLLAGTAAAIAQGNLNVDLAEPRSRDEIGSLTLSFREMQEALKEYMANLAATIAAKERIESELKIARSIQMSFLPKRFPPLAAGDFVEIAALLEPAREVGGDLYDFFMIDDHHLFFTVGDVSDKGVPAALFMAVTKTLLKGLSEVGLEPAQVFAKVNRELVLGNDSLMFVTCFCGILDLETGVFAYSNAGHPPPVLIRPGQEPRWLTLPPGLFLGIDEHTVFGTEQIILQPGDMILAYSDGITEADDLEQRLYSGDRLMATVRDYRGDSAEALLKAVRASVADFAHGAPQADDMTILAARLKHLKTRTRDS